MGSEPANTELGTHSSYTTDVAYTSNFCVIQSPVHLCLAAALRGWVSPRPSLPFTYLDIGCGDGETLAVLAAAYPHGTFIGFDFNARHVDLARSKIAAAGLTNATVIEGDILNIASLISDKFDYAAIMGAYSWIDESRRQAVRSFLSDRANPNAMVLIDYAALPGSVAINLLYDIARRKARALEGDSAERLSGALEGMRSAAERGAKLFDYYPAARLRLNDMKTRNQSDEAHEVFNLGQGQWFEDVAQQMQDVGFCWANTARLTHAYPEFVLPGKLRPDPNLDTEALQFELDIALNTAYRADIFIAPPASRTSVAETLDGLNLMEMGGSARRRLSALLRKAPWIDAKSAWAAIDELTNGQASSRQLKSAVSRAGGDASETIGRLLATSILQPLVHDMLPISGRIERARIPLAYNRQVIIEDIAASKPRPLASPVAGTSLFLPLIDRLTILALVGGDLRSAYEKLVKAGIDTRNAFGDGPDAFRITMHRLVDEFCRSSAIDLVRLGVLASNAQAHNEREAS